MADMASMPRTLRSPPSLQAASKLAGSSPVWTRVFRHFTAPNPAVHRFLPKLKAGRLMLEMGERSEWTQLEVVLAGSTIGDLGLYYYADKVDQTPLGCIQLHSAHIDVLEEVVMVVTQEKTWFLCAEHGRDAGDWAEAICSAIDKVSQGILLHGKPGSRRRRLSSQASHVTLREIQTRQPKARTDEFLEIFVRSSDDDVRLQAMEGAFSWSCMRNIAWKLWLDVLPMDLPLQQWIPTLQSKRRKYEDERGKHSLFKSFLNGQQIDDEFLLACETTEDQLLYGIFKDVRRTRGSMEFFRSASVQCLLIRVLYTYSLAHPEVSYNQGMGELLATIVYLLHIEQWPLDPLAHSITKSPSAKSLSASSSTGSFVTITPSGSMGRLSESDSDDASYVYVESFIDVQDDLGYLDRDRLLRATPCSGVGTGKYLDCCREQAEEIVREATLGEYIEHDGYLLLEEMMDRMAGAYCPEITPPSSSTGAHKAAFNLVPVEMEASPLYDQMNSIHHHVLGRCDPPTARHLASLGVEPQMFLLRWVRVLMSREFDMAQVWQIWDAIFSLTPSDFSFINLLCVAAVREFREEILRVQDPAAVLLCLRDLSDKVDADRLVDNARELYDALMLAAAVEASHSSSTEAV